MTTEEQLKAIIEAQVRGGCDEYPLNLAKLEDGRWTWEELGMYEDYSVIDILLDTEGCKAAYGEEPAMESATTETTNSSDDTIVIRTYMWKDYTKPMWEWASHQILDAWHSLHLSDDTHTMPQGMEPFEGNNYVAAIKKAYDLLPKKS